MSNTRSELLQQYKSGQIVLNAAVEGGLALLDVKDADSIAEHNAFRTELGKIYQARTEGIVGTVMEAN